MEVKRKAAIQGRARPSTPRKHSLSVGLRPQRGGLTPIGKKVPHFPSCGRALAFVGRVRMPNISGKEVSRNGAKCNHGETIDPRGP